VKKNSRSKNAKCKVLVTALLNVQVVCVIRYDNLQRSCPNLLALHAYSMSSLCLRTIFVKGSQGELQVC
jgi:hypothetical protein